MPSHNGHADYRPNMRLCMNKDCRKHCYRSNRFRMWRFITPQEQPGLSIRARFQKADIVLCPSCFNNHQLGRMINLAGGSALPAPIIKRIGFQ